MNNIFQKNCGKNIIYIINPIHIDISQFPTGLTGV